MKSPYLVLYNLVGLITNYGKYGQAMPINHLVGLVTVMIYSPARDTNIGSTMGNSNVLSTIGV
jgi:hypothetical protein